MQADTTAVAIFAGRGKDGQKVESLELSNPGKGIFDALGLRHELVLITEVLPWAASAGPEIRAGGGLAGGRKPAKTEKLAYRIVPLLFNDPHHGFVPRRGEGDENDFSGVAADAVGAVRERIDA
jgi:hypothetical protein